MVYDFNNDKFLSVYNDDKTIDIRYYSKDTLMECNKNEEYVFCNVSKEFDPGELEKFILMLKILIMIMVESCRYTNG